MSDLAMAELLRDVWDYLPDAQRREILELLCEPERDDDAIIAVVAQWADS